ncbi:TetR/AcrR family transcriptional regulator [Kiloniella laminariae]|uniref:TetR/AcrR family transcriptional regulator n=1 Tax=Kiloniella laminariae TaxID=454162 RepID=A0ABT4LRD2_9PROT|nr:TetR/AcrR family transcriptional regulator [Kiloniella laminariae]MCZ4282886.1 TetR/AcrR family transcriptional regulator [Kiloniella laminariae]
MQDQKILRRSNRDRSEDTRTRLISAARKLFSEKGYSDTGTPEIVREAAVTRGALYHHFTDKSELFRAVVMQESRDVAQAINENSVCEPDPVKALVAGAQAYFTAMTKPGRARILLLEGLSVIGPEGMAQIDRETGSASLLKGLEWAAQDANRPDLPLEELTTILSAGFDRAALEISMGGESRGYIRAFESLLESLFRS